MLTVHSIESSAVITSKINKNIVFFIFVNIVKLMSESKDPKNPKENQFLPKGLYVNDDDQDWGSAGMNDVQQEDTE